MATLITEVDESAMDTPNSPPKETAAHLADWVVRKGVHRGTIDSLVEGFARRLIEAGIPLSRMNFMVQVIHPLNQVAFWVWFVNADMFSFRPPRGQTSDQRFGNSPFKVVFETGQPLRRRLTGDNMVLDFPVLQDLIDNGATDYLVAPVRFSDGQVNGLAFATKAPGGFSDLHCDTLMRAARILGGPLETMQMRDLATTLLETYVGQHAGKRVLDGAITRGSGESIRAVIWYCDLRNFTPLSESLPMDLLISVLNDYFEAVGTAIEARDGEILKFVGDAILAIWPLESGDDPAAVCKTAIEAWRTARDNLATLNERRTTEGKPSLDFGATLHVGEVIYGNIGAPDRLDFTVIGPAVNLVTRMEDLTKKLSRPLLLSQSFAEAYGEAVENLGDFSFKGIEKPQAVFGLGAEIPAT
ncbi:MAG: adenylate/guanylate cyclase domain-containing protein [Proteobacteria bacterium]|nr:adenylate/guanylate cyclase domain-containing protein [Pseudomonadota bacterium]